MLGVWMTTAGVGALFGQSKTFRGVLDASLIGTRPDVSSRFESCCAPAGRSAALLACVGG